MGSDKWGRGSDAIGCKRLREWISDKVTTKSNGLINKLINGLQQKATVSNQTHRFPTARGTSG